MPQYLAPGVYVEEVDRGARPIQGVSTSVAGAVGVTARGPTSGKPVLVTSLNEFTRTFGGLVDVAPAVIAQWDSPDKVEGGYWWRFPHAVKGFFDNGGKQLWVKRVFSAASQGAKTNAPAGAQSEGITSEVTALSKQGADKITLRHLFGISGKNAKIKLFDGSGVQINSSAADGAFTVTEYDSKTLALTLNETLPKDLLPGGYAEILPAAAVAGPIKFEARDRGDWGNNLQIRVRPTDQKSSTTLALTAVSLGLITKITTFATTGATAGTVTVANPGLAIGDIVEIQEVRYEIATTPTTTSFTLDPAPTAVDWATTLPLVRKVRSVNPKPVLTTVATYTPSPGAGVNDSITVVSTAGLAAGDLVVIEKKIYTLGANATANTFDINPNKAPGDTINSAGAGLGSVVQKIQPRGDKVLALNAGRSVYPKAIIELETVNVKKDKDKTKEIALVKDVNGNEITFDQPLTHGFYEGDVLRVIELEVGVRLVKNTPDGEVVEAEELFTNLRLADSGSDLSVKNVIDRRSALVTVKDPVTATDFNSLPLSTPKLRWQPLEDGDDALATLTVDDFVGVDGGSGKRTGIAALEDITDISIVVVPGMWSRTIRDAAITHCESLRYRMLITDPPPMKDGSVNPIEDIREFRSPIDTKYAALYFPWLMVRDLVLSTDVPCPPSAHLAGLYARVDTERGVQKAPANEVLRGVNSLQQDVTTREQELLNPLGINAIRSFPNRGIRVWGGRTLSTTDQNFKYVNVRRIFNFIGRSIDEGTQFVVFEPNDETLWMRVRQTVGNFLNTQWRNGVLEGKTAADAFFVACDRGVTMVQAEIENGLLICEVGISPVFPAEFVVFRLQKYVSASKQ